MRSISRWIGVASALLASRYRLSGPGRHPSIAQRQCDGSLLAEDFSAERRLETGDAVCARRTRPEQREREEPGEQRDVELGAGHRLRGDDAENRLHERDGPDGHEGEDGRGVSSREAGDDRQPSHDLEDHHERAGSSPAQGRPSS